MSDSQLLLHEELKKEKFHKPVRECKCRTSKKSDPFGAICRLDNG